MYICFMLQLHIWHHTARHSDRSVHLRDAVPLHDRWCVHHGCGYESRILACISRLTTHLLVRGTLQLSYRSCYVHIQYRSTLLFFKCFTPKCSLNSITASIVLKNIVWTTGSFQVSVVSNNTSISYPPTFLFPHASF